MKVYLKKSLVSELTSNGLLAYVGLRSIYNKEESEAYVSTNLIHYRLCANGNCTRSWKDNILSGIDELVGRGLIKVVEEINKTEIIYDLSGLYFENEYFIQIELEDIRRVLSLPCRTDKGALLKYFVVMVGSFSNIKYESYTLPKRSFVGFMPISYLAREARISESSAMTYNSILEDNKIIFVYRHPTGYVDDEGMYHNLNNNYGLYEDKKYIRQFAKSYEAYTDI